jgi:predicted RNA-binding protein Jag
MRDTILTLAQDFFTRMSIEFDSIQVDAEEDDSEAYRVSIKSPDSKLLIGIHGQSLEQITHLFGRMIEKSSGKHCIIHIEVNDYLKSKEERLFRYVESKIQEAREQGLPIQLSKLTGAERKKIHHYIQAKNDSGIEAYSEGEGENRHLYIRCSQTQSPQATPAKHLSSELNEEGIGI